MRVLRRSRALGLALGVALWASLLGAGTASGQGQGLQEVSVRLNWRVKGEFAPVYAAAALGFFEREGLEVTIGEGRGTTEAILQVATGRDDFGYIPTPQAILSVNEGLPVTMVATLATETSMAWVSRTPLHHPRDVEGRTVSISAASTFAQVWEVFARAHQVDTARVRVVSPDPAARFSLFFNGDVDVLGDIFLTNEYPVIAAQAEDELHVLAMADWGFDLLGYGVLAHREAVARRPGVVRAFLRGLLAGFQYTLEHPGEAARLMAARFPDLSVEVTQAQIDQLLPLLTRDRTGRVSGRVSAPRWQESLDILHRAGYLLEVLPLERYVTYDFLPGEG